MSQNLPDCNSSRDCVLIETPFIETTRRGQYLDSVIIALTPRILIIKSTRVPKYHESYTNESSSHLYYPLEITKLTVFKKSKRQSLKICLNSLTDRYFELGQLDKRKKKRQPWTEKYLYLGSKREAEDQERPKPVPGLDLTEDIKVFYLKPKYFGCWDQSEHWVQCGNSTTSLNY